MDLGRTALFLAPVELIRERTLLLGVRLLRRLAREPWFTTPRSRNRFGVTELCGVMQAERPYEAFKFRYLDLAGPVEPLAPTRSDSKGNASSSEVGGRVFNCLLVVG